MLQFKSVSRFSNKNSILMNILTYNNTQKQAFSHRYIQDSRYEREIKLKKQQVKINQLLKNCDRGIKIRQFVFEEPYVSNTVFPEGVRFFPTEKWTSEEIEQMIGYITMQDDNDQFRADLTQLVQRNKEKLRQKLQKYYRSKGETGRGLDVMREVQKIRDMSQKQFKDFLQRIK